MPLSMWFSPAACGADISSQCSAPTPCVHAVTTTQQPPACLHACTISTPTLTPAPRLRPHLRAGGAEGQLLALQHQALAACGLQGSQACDGEEHLLLRDSALKRAALPVHREKAQEGCRGGVRHPAPGRACMQQPGLGAPHPLLPFKASKTHQVPTHTSLRCPLDPAATPSAHPPATPGSAARP